MEPSNVLIALEEWEKWRSRKTKLESRLEKLHREREALRAEHEAVKRELAVMREAMLEPIASRRDVQEFPPHGLGRGMVDAHA
nr:hypothetical protein [Anaerolineae bacterium]